MSREKPTGMDKNGTDGPVDGKAGYKKKTILDAIDVGRQSLHLAKAGVAKPCWICGGAVSLELCKTDENGNAVHEACYVARVMLNLPR